MSNTSKKLFEKDDINGSNADNVVSFLRHAINEGTQWYIALLTAVGMWNSAEENYAGKHYKYVVDGDAFDFFLLVKRLCQSVHRLIPENEREDLLLLGKPPITLTSMKIRELMGEAKYQAYLNYVYGIIVEKAITQYVEDEIRKEERAAVFHKKSNVTEEAFQRVYNATRTELNERFRTEENGQLVDISTMQEEKEFTYWCFKYRIRNCNKEKVASDTRKGLKKLNASQMTKLALRRPATNNLSRSSVIDVGLNW